ncbi:DUF695 domain-containing protein [Wenyingzhuangia sp. IMCC45574]
MESTAILEKNGFKEKDKIRELIPLRFIEKRISLPNNKSGISLFNSSYRKFKKRNAASWCLNITVSLDKKFCDKDGLPLIEESFISSQFEKKLIVELMSESDTNIHYVGHIYKEFCLEMYLYLESPEEIYDFMEEKFNQKKLTRGFVYEIIKDTKWDLVNNYIDAVVLDETIANGKLSFPWLNRIFVEHKIV